MGTQAPHPDATQAPQCGPTLDQESEPWVASFPTLGTVQVHADGSIEVEVEPDDGDEPEDSGLREDALRYGWGEPLSLVRRGFRCAWGTAVVPAEGRGCLIVTGAAHDVAIVLVELVAAGWSVLSDRIVPTTRSDGTLLAHPRSAPVLISRRRAQRSELEGRSIRADSDAVAIDPPRATEPHPVLAFVDVGLRRPRDLVLEQLTGHERFSAASFVTIGGVMAGTEHSENALPGDVMRSHVELAKLPFARFRFRAETIDVDIAELDRWWSPVASGGDTP